MSEKKGQSAGAGAGCMELFFSCNDLPKEDFGLSKCDPYIWVKKRRAKDEPNWSEVGTTETYNNNSDPVFKKRFEVPYLFEENVELLLEVWDSNAGDDSLRCSAVVPLSKILHAADQKLTLPLTKDGNQRGSITITGNMIGASNDTLVINVCGEGLAKHDFLGKSDPFLIFSRKLQDGTEVKVHETEIKKKTLDPNWGTIEIKARAFCGNDYDLPITVRCYDWDEGSEPDQMGECQITVNEILKEKKYYPLYKYKKPKKKDKNKGPVKDTKKNRGCMVFENCGVKAQHSFVDFVKAGLDLQLCIAVDYTSGKDQLDLSGKEHSFKDAKGYAEVMRVIGTVLKDYDSDGKVPVFGFGAIEEGQGEASMCFNVNGKENPECELVEGAIESFMSSLDRVTCAGPTLFEPSIRRAMKIAGKPWTANSQHYVVLLILTSGEINDMQHTINALVEAADYPLSVIIAGLGSNEFSQMKQLDGDRECDHLQNSKGEFTKRDIVQFVKIRDFKGKHQSEIAEQTLHEIPQQLADFIELTNALPLTHHAAGMQKLTQDREKIKMQAEAEKAEKERLYYDSINELKALDIAEQKKKEEKLSKKEAE